MGIPNIDAQVSERGAIEARLTKLMGETWTDAFPTVFSLLKELREVKRDA
jgi:hypothetical protein